MRPQGLLVGLLGVLLLSQVFLGGALERLGIIPSDTSSSTSSGG